MPHSQDRLLPSSPFSLSFFAQAEELVEAAGRGRSSKGREACSMDCMSLSKRKDGGKGNEADMN